MNDNQIVEDATDFNPDEFTSTEEEEVKVEIEHTWTTLPGHRLNLVTFPRTEKTYHAKRSCTHCHGTGIAGLKCAGELAFNPVTKKNDYMMKVPIACTCLVVVETEEKEQVDAKEE